MKKLILFSALFCAMAANAVTIKTSDLSNVDNAIYGIDAEVNTDGEATMSICMKNNFAVPAFQFDIETPAGFEVATDEDGFLLVDLSTARTSSKKTDTFGSAIVDGNVRVLAASTRLATFSGNDGEVCTVVFRQIAPVASGEHTITIKNVVLSDVDGGTVKPEPTTASLIVPNPTSVDFVAADKAAVVGIYSVDGACRSELQQGVNLVRYKDGSVKKVLVK